MKFLIRKSKQKRFYSGFEENVTLYLQGKISYKEFLWRFNINEQNVNICYTTYIRWLKIAEENALSFEKKVYIIIKILRYLNTDLYYITPKDLTTFKEFEEDFKSDNYRHLNLFKKFGEIVVNSVVESYWNFLEKKPYEIDKFKRTLIILRSVSSSLIIFVIRYVYHSFNAVFTSKKSKAIALIYLFFNTFLIGAYFMGLVFMLSPHFYSNKQIADVNEEIRYSWMIPNMHDGSLISFGDGSFEKLTPADSKISHHYPYQGKYTVTLYTWNWFGLTAKKHLTIEIQNTPPKFSVSLPENAIEDEIIEIKIHRLQDSIVDLEKGIQFLYDFGDETQLKSKEMKVKHQWVNEGTYPVIITGFDDQGAFSQCKKNISIQNEVPIPKFSYSDYSKNGENINPAEILFSAEGSKDTSSDMGTLSYVWDFGDGYFGYGQHTSHIYDRARNFKTTLYVTDDNGATGTISKQVNAYNFNSNIEREQFPNKAPEILGSDTIPQIIEGTMASLESEVYDTFSEEKNLNFAWYDENGRVVSTNRKPSLLLDDGEYTYLLNVTDKGGNYSTKEIKVNVENYAPEVFVSNYWYNGPVYDEMENCSNSGTIQLKAYAFDSLFDINSLSFEWRITDGKDLVTIDDTPGTYFSTIEFHCKKSTIYNGVVEVTDPSGTKGYKTFQIRALIDDNGNGFLNEFEETLKYSGETISNFTDSDNDYLTDINEMLYWKTSPYNKDTDGDGLLDGYDASGIGELTLGTNPLLADSDSDGLNDGYELYGRNISITKMNGKMIIYTTSDPFFNDTDNDGVSDYKEFQLGTNLRVKDTDGDGLDDLNDPFPTTYDQDEDGISDFKEFRLGTCLNQSDTDEDGLQDGEELYGWGIMGFQTNPLLPDNDFDFLSDGSEVKTYHVGLENDYEQEIRVNVTNPLILHFPYRFRQAAAAHIAFSLSFGEDNGDPQVEYGVPSTEVKNLKITIRQSLYDKILYEINTNGTRYYSEDIDITKIMNNKTFGYNYYGDYILEVNDTGAGCLIEQYELEFTRYLDPLNSDFDHDGIMDGVEANLYVRGTKGIDFLEVFEEEEVGEMILNYSAHMGTFIDIPFATPEIGRIYDMDIDLVFQADNELSSDGTIEIILMKVPNNRTLPRDKIFEESRTFYEGTNPTFHLHFDLGNFIHEHEIGAVNGKFLLRFKISPSIGDNSLFNDTFTVTTLKAALSTYTDAKPYNYDAWVTDPALFDTDGDTLSDYQEIYSLHTNPLNSDTDFDNATDNNDRDPHRNLILEITPEYASWYNEPWYLGTPTFQIVMEAHLDDNPTVIYSKPYTANEGLQYTPLPRNVVRNFPEDHYYLDVNDDITLQHEWIIFKLTLYAYTGSLTGHLFIMSGETYYHIRDAGHEQILAVSLRGDTGTDYAKIKVKTLAIEHANTIAIYRKNTTDFTGHYREAERMNIIQLYLNDDTSFTGTPFVQGPNVIVIPTSLFSDTVLNGYIENERLDETSLYSEVEGEFEFYSIDRDGNIQEDANGEDDFVFVRFNINARQAMEILDLLTTCGVNETEDEPGEHVLKTKVLYRYCSTKINGTTANLLNLPNSAMGFVPWFCPYESAEMGPKPTPFNPLGLFVVIGVIYLIIVSPVAGLIFAGISTSLALVTDQNNDLAKMLGLVLLTFLAKLVWLAIRTALIVFAYICLAFELLTTTGIILALGGTLSLLGAISDISCQWAVNWWVPYGVSTKIGYIYIFQNTNEFKFESWIDWIYWDFFDMYFPMPRMDFDMDTSINKPIENPTQAIAPTLECGYDQIKDTLKYDFHTVYTHACNQPPEYVKLTLISPIGRTFNYSMSISENAIYSENWYDKLFTKEYWIGKIDLITGEVYSFDEVLQSFIPPNWYRGVRYNTTINFEQQFSLLERQGQWYYYFSTNSTKWGYNVTWPWWEGCFPGPNFDEMRDYLRFSDLEPYEGSKNKEYSFRVTGADFQENKQPNQVYLHVLFPDNDIYKFTMNNISSYVENIGDFSQPKQVRYTDFQINIDFSLFIDVEEPLKLHYYFSATFDDGKISNLWDFINYDENDTEYIEGKNEGYYDWFEGPQIYPSISYRPMIKAWYIEKLDDGILYDKNSRGNTGPIFREQVLRFWLYVEYPSENFYNTQQLRPELIFINLDSPNSESSPIYLAETGEHFGPGPLGFKEYFVDIVDGKYTYQHFEDFGETSFGPGAFNVIFRVKYGKDNDNFVQEKSQIIIWNIGSVTSFMNTLFYGAPEFATINEAGLLGVLGSIIISGGYILTGLISKLGEKGEKIAQIMAIALANYELVNSFVSYIQIMRESDDTGALLGHAVGLLLRTAGFCLALHLSKSFQGKFDLGGITKFSGILMLFEVFMLFNSYMDPDYMIDENGQLHPVPSEVFAIDSLLMGLPSMILGFLATTLGLSAILAIASGNLMTPVPLPGGAFTTSTTSKIVLISALINAMISGLAFFSFLQKTGFFHLMYS